MSKKNVMLSSVEHEFVYNLGTRVDPKKYTLEIVMARQAGQKR